MAAIFLGIFLPQGFCDTSEVGARGLNIDPRFQPADHANSGMVKAIVHGWLRCRLANGNSHIVTRRSKMKRKLEARGQHSDHGVRGAAQCERAPQDSAICVETPPPQRLADQRYGLAARAVIVWS